MSIYFVKTVAIVATPSDTNDGLDPIGFALSAATFTNSTKTLSSTGAFSTYTFTSGDLIYISGGTGVTAGLYEISSKTDADNIVLVDDIGGTDPIDVTSSDGPFATVGHAFNEGGTGNTSMGAGDTIRICDDGTHSITALTPPAWSGTAASPVLITGADVRGIEVNNTDPSTWATVQLSASASTAMIDLQTNTQAHTQLKNLVLDGNNNGSTSGAERALVRLGRDYVGAFRCKLINHSVRGFDFDGRNACYVRECITDSVFSEPCQVVAGRGTVITSNRFDSNGAGVIDITATAGEGAVVYNNILIGCQILAEGDGVTVEGNTVYDTDGDGIKVTGGSSQVINNTVSQAGAYSYNFNGVEPYIFANNHSSSPTTDHTNLSGSFADIGQGNNVTGDPLFASTTGGSEDFTPGSGSPLINAGTDVGVGS